MRHGGVMMKPSKVRLLALAFLLAPSLAAGLDWPMYGRDLKHSFTNADSLINPSNVTLLAPAWDFTTGDAVSASPAVVDGVVYVGSWDGFFYALDAASGTLMWSFQVDCQSTVQPIPAQCPGGPSAPQDRAQTDGGLITSSAAVVDGKVYFAGGSGPTPSSTPTGSRCVVRGRTGGAAGSGPRRPSTSGSGSSSSAPRTAASTPRRPTTRRCSRCGRAASRSAGRSAPVRATSATSTSAPRRTSSTSARTSGSAKGARTGPTTSSSG